MNAQTKNLDKDIYQKFRSLYEEHGSLNAVQIESIYADLIVFKDPIHTISGLPALRKYFASIGANINMCRFEFIEEMVMNDCAHITWNMHFSHQKIDSGKEKCVRGMSYIKFENNKIVYHEDCYDLGSMIYEHLPILGVVTRWLKKRIA